MDTYFHFYVVDVVDSFQGKNDAFRFEILEVSREMFVCRGKMFVAFDCCCTISFLILYTIFLQFCFLSFPDTESL